MIVDFSNSILFLALTWCSFSFSISLCKLLSNIFNFSSKNLSIFSKYLIADSSSNVQLSYLLFGFCEINLYPDQ